MTTINSLEDILQALDDNPAWREAVRLRILGEELLRLPAAFDRFVQEQKAWNEEQKAWNEEQRAWNEEQRAWNEEQRAWNEEQKAWNTRIEARFDRMEADNSYFKNKYTEAQTREQAAIIANAFSLQFVRSLTPVDLVAMTPDRLTRDASISFQKADLVIEATDGQETTYIAVEVSFTGATRDVDRAIRNAGIIAEATGRPAYAAIASVRNDFEVQEAIDSGQVLWYPMEE